MFDAKSLLEQLAGGARQQAQADPPGGGLGDLLGQMSRSGGGGLDGLLRGLTGGAGSGAGSGASGGGLQDILDKVKQQVGTSGNSDLLGTLRQVLDQATQGAKEGAGRVGEATGARDALTRATGGRTPEDLAAQIKDLIANNQLTAGAVLGGLGGLLLGTGTGREVLGGAMKVGALALIGGLAYKAYQNHQAGKPLLTDADETIAPAPAGSGFEAQAVTNDGATLIIRAMIAAAAADGTIDSAERGRILDAAQQGASIDPEAEAFLTREMANPASAAALAQAVTSQAEALQVYTAARIAIDPDSATETSFLSDLARALNIEPGLAAQIDSGARQAA